MAKTKTTKRKTNKRPQPLKFDKKLVLNQFMLHLFGVKSFEELATGMKEPEQEGLDENNISRHCRHLSNRLPDYTSLSEDLLLQYDQNIVRHTMTIRGKRERPITWKYFQYLALLFTEIYLDRYFSDAEKLLTDLNEWVEQFNRDKDKREQVNEFHLDDLNKLAFWMATGSGKTLLMHVNILQYRHYLKKHGRARELNRVILLTPNEGLSGQHDEEFKLSGIPARKFAKENTASKKFKSQFTMTLFEEEAPPEDSIDIIDIYKLRDDMGEKTVAVSSFEGNNLVLVDEGHRGSSSSSMDWKNKRDQLCAQGFSFEYSATFGQAIKASSKNALEQEYARCILFDYSYKYFWKDGYGKQFNILNLPDDRDETARQRYLTACLLAFYQQLRLFKDKKREFASFLLEKPLLVFVGGSVNAVRAEKKRKVSDVVDILLFINTFLIEEARVIETIDRLLHNKPDLLDEKGRGIFTGAFTYLNSLEMDTRAVYEDILKIVFNSPSRALLHLDRFKQAGEIGLRVGDNEYFGVINVGDDNDLLKLCEQNGLETSNRDIADSLFAQINNEDSRVKVLIGSKKFSEGWNSWRVSTMGFMNIGRQKGSEIIQLFGRGVRLKGYNYSLKRSNVLLGEQASEFIDKLETLNVFGIRSDYMQQFKEYLKNEDLPTEENWKPFVLPVVQMQVDNRLKIIKLKDGVSFKRKGPRPVLEMPNERILNNPVIVNWYPKLQAIQSSGGGSTEVAQLEKAKLKDEHVDLLDIEAIYFELVRFKNERNMTNLNLSREVIVELLKHEDWYTLNIPKHELEFDSLDKVRRWQEIALALLKKYCERYYNYKRGEYEKDKIEYKSLVAYQQEDSVKEGNLINKYHLRIQEDQDKDFIRELERLKKDIEKDSLRELSFGNFETIEFDRHLYQPLIYFEGESVKVSPVALNKGEKRFVLDLRAFHGQNKDFFADKELYLLRNQGRGRGVGFFDANNFYPDFIMWLLVGDKQYITFVDPKGLRNTEGLEDPKIEFYATIKEIEGLMGDPQVILNSFIISQTPFKKIKWWRPGLTEQDLEESHVLFPREDDQEYIGKIFKRIGTVGSLGYNFSSR